MEFAENVRSQMRAERLSPSSKWGTLRCRSNRGVLIKKLEVLGKAFDRNLSTRDLYWNFAKHIFRKKHGVDPISNPKSKLKLLSAVEPLRRVLSGGSDGILHEEW
jgi:hypothetical protein